MPTFTDMTAVFFGLSAFACIICCMIQVLDTHRLQEELVYQTRRHQQKFQENYAAWCDLDNRREALIEQLIAELNLSQARNLQLMETLNTLDRAQRMDSEDVPQADHLSFVDKALDDFLAEQNVEPEQSEDYDDEDDDFDDDFDDETYYP